MTKPDGKPSLEALKSKKQGLTPLDNLAIYPEKKLNLFIKYYCMGPPGTRFNIANSTAEAGVSRQMYYNWVAKYPDLKDILKEYQENFEMIRLQIVEERVFSKAIDQDDFQAQKFLLQTLYKKYRPKTDLDITSDGQPIKVIFTSPKTDDNTDKV